MNEILYEAEAFYGINPAFIIFLLVIILMSILLIIFWRKVDIGVKIFISIIIFFFVLICFCQIYVSIDARNKVYNKYQSGQYLVTEGAISNYTVADKCEPNLPDYFWVNDIEFKVPGFVSPWGYPLKQIDGGILNDGMNVKIYYIEYKNENVIMRIEHLVTKE